jgi:hypothetical protein
VPPLERSNAPVRRPFRGANLLDAGSRAAVERAARVADGLAILEGAPLECAAVLLGLPPPAIERVRAALEVPLARSEARALFARAAARGPGSATAAAPAPPTLDAERLLSVARERPDGLDLLCAASPECAAVAFGVHPDLVDAARELARRRGLARDFPPDR